MKTQLLKYKARDYQAEAVELLNQKFSSNRFLFDMPTGSGKTYIMAEAILSFRAKGYKKFLFVTSRISVLEKTKLNLIYTPDSPACLFATDTGLTEVEAFTHSDALEIVFISTQGLHAKIQTESDSSLSLASLNMHKLCIIADEAHHHQATTKADSDRESFETSIAALLNTNKANKLLEFSATINVSNRKTLKDKYSESDTVVYKYPIKSFYKDGYSKFLRTTRLEDKALAVKSALISNYIKYKTALKTKEAFIPIILYKVNTIADIEETKVFIKKVIQELSYEDITKLSTSGFNFIFNLSHQDVEDIKVLYSKESAFLTIHSKMEEQEKLYLLNKINNIDNQRTTLPVRHIIQVDVLTEGIDIKTIYNIVLFNNSTDIKVNTKDIQLLGRGLRYCNFSLKTEVSKRKVYKRRFDRDTVSEFKELETLDLASVAENKSFTNYINNAEFPVVNHYSDITINYNIDQKYLNIPLYTNKLFDKNDELTEAEEALYSNRVIRNETLIASLGKINISLVFGNYLRSDTVDVNLVAKSFSRRLLFNPKLKPIFIKAFNAIPCTSDFFKKITHYNLNTASKLWDYLSSLDDLVFDTAISIRYQAKNTHALTSKNYYEVYSALFSKIEQYSTFYYTRHVMSDDLFAKRYLIKDLFHETKTLKEDLLPEFITAFPRAKNKFYYNSLILDSSYEKDAITNFLQQKADLIIRNPGSYTLCYEHDSDIHEFEPDFIVVMNLSEKYTIVALVEIKDIETIQNLTLPESESTKNFQKSKVLEAYRKLIKVNDHEYAYVGYMDYNGKDIFQKAKQIILANPHIYGKAINETVDYKTTLQVSHDNT